MMTQQAAPEQPCHGACAEQAHDDARPRASVQRDLRADRRRGETGGGRSTWFSRAVAAHAVRNSTNWDTVKMKISRPRIGPNACARGRLGHRGAVDHHHPLDDLEADRGTDRRPDQLRQVTRSRGRRAKTHGTPANWTPRRRPGRAAQAATPAHPALPSPR